MYLHVLKLDDFYLMSHFLSAALPGVVPAWSELSQPLWFWLDRYGW